MNAGGVLLTGGTGFVGSHVIESLLKSGVPVWVWSRNAAAAGRRLPAAVRVVDALARIPADSPIDVVVNLAGAPVIGPPWTGARRRVLVDSRVKTTEALLAWSAARTAPPRVLVSASAIGFYGPRGDAWVDEHSAPQPVFQSELCQALESATLPASTQGIRVVNLRLGLVLGKDGGILARLALPAKLGLAAVIADGHQWMSWIHIEDMVRIVHAVIDEPRWSGPVNAVAPEPARQRDFQRALTRVLQRPLWLRIPGFALRWTLGDMSELLVAGQRVAPKRLRDAGFEFRHPALEGALRQLLVEQPEAASS